jgi:hypothetical protein
MSSKRKTAMTKQPSEDDIESPSGIPEGFMMVPEMSGGGITSEVVYRPKPPRAAFINKAAGKAAKVKGEVRNRRVK